MDHLELILSLIEESKREDFLSRLEKEDYWGADIDPEFMGFLDDYINIANNLRRIPEDIKINVNTLSISSLLFNYKIYDIGCGYGYQHLFFRHSFAYVGYGPFWNNKSPEIFTDNAQFINATLEDAAESIRDDIKKLPKEIRPFGIANMSILYGKNEDVQKNLSIFDSLFMRKWVM